MKTVITILALFGTLQAFADTGIQRCGPFFTTASDVSDATTQLAETNQMFLNGGTASQLDVLNARVKLDETKYCSGIDSYSKADFCSEKRSDLTEALKLTKQEMLSGTLNQNDVAAVVAKLTAHKTFCASK